MTGVHPQPEVESVAQPRCPERCTCGTRCGREVGPCGRCLQHCICSDDNEGLRELGRRLGL